MFNQIPSVDIYSTAPLPRGRVLNHTPPPRHRSPRSIGYRGGGTKVSNVSAGGMPSGIVHVIMLISCYHVNAFRATPPPPQKKKTSIRHWNKSPFSALYIWIVSIEPEFISSSQPVRGLQHLWSPVCWTLQMKEYGHIFDWPRESTQSHSLARLERTPEVLFAECGKIKERACFWNVPVRPRESTSTHSLAKRGWHLWSPICWKNERMAMFLKCHCFGP